MAADHLSATEATLRAVLEQLVMLDVGDIRIEPHGAAGSVARIMSIDGLHEVVCELDADGGLRSARVIAV